MIVYKTLKADGRSQYQKWEWPLPQDGLPGEWVEVEGGLQLCANGLHGWLTEAIARHQHGSAPLIYEMEIDEDADVIRDGEKACGRRARLLRLVYDQNGPVIAPAELVWQ